MDKRFEIIDFHESLHCFLKDQGTRTSSMEAKLAQQLAFLEQEVLYEKFVDLKKAYDTMDSD